MVRSISVPQPETKALRQGKADSFSLQKERPPGCPPEAALLCEASTTLKSKALKERCSQGSKGLVLQAEPAPARGDNLPTFAAQAKTNPSSH